MIGRVTPPDPDVLDMWVVYKNPTDYPDKYVARLHRVVDNEVGAASEFSEVDFVIANDLTEIQTALKIVGRTQTNRFPDDDPVIVEVWL